MSDTVRTHEVAAVLGTTPRKVLLWVEQELYLPWGLSHISGVPHRYKLIDVYHLAVVFELEKIGLKPAAIRKMMSPRDDMAAGITVDEFSDAIRLDSHLVLSTQGQVVESIFQGTVRPDDPTAWIVLDMEKIRTAVDSAWDKLWAVAA